MNRTGFVCCLCAFTYTPLAIAAPSLTSYNVCVIPVDFSDNTAPADALDDFQSAWLQPMKDFFSQQSNEQFTLNAYVVSPVIRLGERRFYRPCALGSSCRNLWSSTDNPISQAVAAGKIVASSAGIRPPGGTRADVFQGFLFLTPRGVGMQLPGWAIAGQRPSAEIGTRTYAMGHAPIDIDGDFIYDDGEWGPAAHELGHMFGAGNYEHPANYNNAWELMDSCYPCAIGIFGRAEKDLITGNYRTWFEGWLPPERFKQFVAPVGGTEVIAPIEIDPDETTAPMGLQVLTGANYSYFVETRRYIIPDHLNGPPRDTREGVLILKATPGAAQETEVQLAPPYTNMNRWTSTFVPGQTFTDAARDLTISIGPEAGNGFTVTVAYGPGATSPVPDVGIIPWLTPPMNTWETVDIWVDSPCNGLERDAPGDTRRLRYGRRADGTVIGNGDDPCVNENNLVYARIRNLGTANANNVVVHFQVTDPPGLGMRGPGGWAEFGTVTAAQFPELASIPPGSSVDVFATWRPSVTFEPGTFRAPYHACLRVICDNLPGELVTTNQDGDREQENVGWFEMRRPTLEAPYVQINEQLLLFNDKNDEREYLIGYTSELPEDWQLQIGEDELSYLLMPSEPRQIPVKILAPPGTPIGQSFFINAAAYQIKEAFAPDGTFNEYQSKEVSGVLLAAQTVLDSNVVITSVETQEGPPPAATVTGQLLAPLSGAILSLRFLGPGTSGSLEITETDANGNFTCTNTKVFPGKWSVRAMFAGTTERASAASEEVYFTVPGTEGESDGAVEGSSEGEYAGYSADLNGDFKINLSELLRLIQFYNAGGLHCQKGTEDGYAPGPGDTSCPPHKSDYSGGNDWKISLAELLRGIQFYNSLGFYPCANSEDGFCPSKT